MQRRTFTRTVGSIAGLTALGVGVTAGHSPGESEDAGESDNDNSGNACHDDGSGNKEQEDEGSARDGDDTKNPECET